ncbi:hypothetical protein [Ligilactobacillus sp. WC1T17]
MLQVQETVYLEDGRALEYTIERHPYDQGNAYTLIEQH